MSEMQRWQSAEALELWQPYGYGKVIRSNKSPVGGEIGFAPMCMWVDPVNGKEYRNIGLSSNATWVEDDGTAGEQTRFGLSTLGAALSTMFSEGNLYRDVGNPIAGNGADLTDDIVDGFQLPANAFDVANRQLIINFNGSFASNGDNKDIKFWLNATMSGQTINATTGRISGGTVTGVGTGVKLYDSGVITNSGGAWQISTNFCKIGVNGTNTQYSITTAIFATVHQGTTTALFPTQAENAVMNFVITLASPTSGLANDLVLQWVEVNAMN